MSSSIINYNNIRKLKFHEYVLIPKKLLTLIIYLNVEVRQNLKFKMSVNKL